MASCGDKSTKQKLCEKILRSLHLRFDYGVCAIEESKDIFVLSLEELQGTLEARELRMDETSGGNSGNQALVAYANKKGDKKKKWRKNKFKKPEDKSESSSKGGNSSGKSKGKSRNFDKKKVQCYNCEKFKHVAYECWADKGGKHKKKKEDEACAAQEYSSSDLDTILLLATTNGERSPFSDTVLLITTTNKEHSSSQVWFLDIDIDTSRRSKIRFVEDRTLEAEGAGNMVIKRRNGSTIVIENVLYVPEMKSNLLSIGQLIQKGFQVIMKNDVLEMYDGQKNIILMVPLSKNKTFLINIQVADIQCLKASSSIDENWLWNSYD
ncbi:uncharacterized protein [Cicer arietinum]|uniref:Uncharacterized protein LOC101498282 n=1 Tax=Cicer arietinum TaxID=3827 RepID=A0A1S2Y7E6_CICAR|nr:uncharacterized protein LOC101498282 [Cicer arietinum]